MVRRNRARQGEGKRGLRPIPEGKQLETAPDAVATTSASSDAGAASASSASSALSAALVLKVSLGEDMRRLRVAVGQDSSEAEWLSAVQVAVQQGFGLSPAVAEVGGGLVLKYKDDEGDLCTLAKATVGDFLSFSQCSATPRLFAQVQAPAALAGPALSGSVEHGAGAPTSSLGVQGAGKRDMAQHPVTLDSAAPKKTALVGKALYTSADESMSVHMVETREGVWQPSLLTGRGAFALEVCVGEKDEAFAGTDAHVEVLERCEDILQSTILPSAAQVPVSHRVALEDGQGVTVRLCVGIG